MRVFCRTTLLVLSLATCVSGCGWTPRDDHLARQRVSITPQRGDGSRFTTRLGNDPFRTQAGVPAAEATR